MKARIETVSAITLKVAQMGESVRFYQGVLGLEIVYGGANATFTSLRIPPPFRSSICNWAARWQIGAESYFMSQT
jgi:hypothetical protein